MTDWVDVNVHYVRALRWPPVCACCGGPSDTSYRLGGANPTSLRDSFSGTTARYDVWDVPYCSICVGHLEARDRLRGLLPALLVMLFIVAAAWTGARIYALGILAVGIGALVYNVSMLRRKTKSCRDVGVAVQFRSNPKVGELNFRFKNSDYAATFAGLNSTFVVLEAEPLLAPPPATTTILEPGAERLNPRDGQWYVWIPPGTFLMGASPGDSECFEDEKPAHTVTITRGFWMGETPVTQCAYQKVTGKGHKSEDLPAVRVTWDEAKQYAEAIGMRLPTEAEWEWAARGGTTWARYGWPVEKIAWCEGGFTARAEPVRQKQPNVYRLYDMLGNVWEWVADWYGPYQPGDQTDPLGPNAGECRILRGGSSGAGTRLARSSSRYRAAPDLRDDEVGFRCVTESF